MKRLFLFDTSLFLSVWILLLTSNLVLSGTWSKCYGQDCSCDGIDYGDYDPSTTENPVDYRDLQLRNVDKTKCGCLFEGNGTEMDCFSDEKVIAVCWEITKYKSTGQPITKYCEGMDRSKPLELGCKPLPDWGPDAEQCFCVGHLCNNKYINQFPKRQ